MIHLKTAQAPRIVTSTAIAAMFIILQATEKMAQAQTTYKCKDTSGKITYSDRRCDYISEVVDVRKNSKSEVGLNRQNQQPNPLQYFNTDGEKLSLNFENIQIGSLLQVMSDFSGKRLVANPSLKQGVDIRVSAMPWHLALIKVTTENGMAIFKVREGTFLIIPSDMTDQAALNMAKNMGL